MIKKKVISFGVSVAPYEEFIDTIIDLGRLKASSYVCVANVHMVIEAHRNKEFAKHVDGADVVTPDGMPLAKSIRFLYGIQQPRITGSDLISGLLAEAEKRKLSVYFYGSTDEVLRSISIRALAEHPALQIAGSYSPPFRELTEAEEQLDIQRINDSGANIVFVALGCPKQETWMAKNKGRMNAVMLGVGAAFPFYAGVIKRAPEWLQNLSLEWLYRLSREPSRLFWRYFYTNTLFILLMFRELVFQPFNKKSS